MRIWTRSNFHKKTFMRQKRYEFIVITFCNFQINTQGNFRNNRQITCYQQGCHPVRENLSFRQSQGKAREFCKNSGKISVFVKGSEKSGHFGWKVREFFGIQEVVSEIWVVALMQMPAHTGTKRAGFLTKKNLRQKALKLVPIDNYF